MATERKKSLTRSGNCPAKDMAGFTCLQIAYREYGGLCPAHWIKLTDEKREALTGIPGKEIVTYREVVTPPPQPLLAVLKFVWCAAVTAALVLLTYWRTR